MGKLTIKDQHKYLYSFRNIYIKNLIGDIKIGAEPTSLLLKGVIF